MESHAQSVEDNLIDGLSFKLRAGASYVTDRRSVTFFPQGGNSYASNGVRVIKISLNGDQWLDPSTVKLMFTINNRATVPNPATGPAARLYPLTAVPHCFFRRFRLICGGQVIEDIDNYNRVSEMFYLLQPAEKRMNDAIEGVGGTYNNALG